MQTGITISTNGSKKLTKNQERFNKLTDRIEKLEKDIVLKEQMLHKILDHFTKNIDPLLEKEAKNKIQLAFLVEEKMLSAKLSKKAQAQAQEIILYLLNEAFVHVIANEEEIALYNRFSDLSYDDEKEMEMAFMKAEMEAMFSQQGIDIDLTDIDIENEEEVAKLMGEFQEKMQKKQLEDKQKEAEKPKKKTKKEIVRENIEKAKIEAQNKSLKSIYISLTKALHPDTESDPEEKSKKEELMKKVTVAYQEKNFPLLLQLEMEWIHQTSEHLNTLSDDKLNIYIEILLERERELQVEKYRLQQHPRFQKVRDFAHMIEKSAIRSINSNKKSLQENEKFFEMVQRILNSSKTKGDITEMIHDLHFKFVEVEIDFGW
jgi:hypothetical protein